MHPLNHDFARVLISEGDVQRRVAELGAQLSADYQDSNPLLVCVLKGGYVFLADLTRASIRHGRFHGRVQPWERDRVQRGGAHSRTWTDITGRHVLIVEDIIDTGRTITTTWTTCASGSLPACASALLSKPSRREVDLDIDYIGFEIPTDLSSATASTMPRLSQPPFIGVLKPGCTASLSAISAAFEPPQRTALTMEARHPPGSALT